MRKKYNINFATKIGQIEKQKILIYERVITVHDNKQISLINVFPNTKLFVISMA